MTEPVLPPGLIEARRTPEFDAESVPAGLLGSHHTTVWAQIHVLSGTLVFRELGGLERALDLRPGESAVIVPEVAHRVELASDTRFYVQFYRSG